MLRVYGVVYRTRTVLRILLGLQIIIRFALHEEFFCFESTYRACRIYILTSLLLQMK